MRWTPLLVAILLLGACSSGSGPSEADLDGRRFVSADRLPAVVSFSDGRLTVIDCASSSGPYVIDDGRLRFADPDHMFSTLANICIEDNHRVATPGLDRLRHDGLVVRLDGDELTLTDGDTRIRLTEA